MSKIKVKTIYLIAIIVGGLIGLSIKSTYAMFTSSLEIDNPICMSTNLSTSDDIVDTMEVTVQAGETKEVPITINNTSNSLLNYIVFYNSSSTDIETGVNMSNTDSSPEVGTINSNTTKKVYAQLKNNSSSSVTITLGVISSSMSTDMNILSHEELTIINGNNLAEYITNLYTSSTKSTTAVNNITYNLASSVNLMSDRLASSSVNADSGNIRYYGASPNNYIYFNCSDYSNQNTSTCEVWRIIGVFNNKVKIMRSSSIGNYSLGSYNWPDASLMKLLNSGYESESVGGSLYWNAGSGTCYGANSATTSCNFTTTGLKNSVTRNLISKSVYYLLGHNSASIYIDVMYNYERGSGSIESGGSASWEGNIALLHASDYGYAADLSQCKLTLGNYSSCAGNNWMKTIITSNSSTVGWLSTPYSIGNYMWYVETNGTVGAGRLATSYAHAVVPTLYLNADTLVEDTSTGTINNPFKIVVS